jgi:5-methylcytosine-specific restriction endonuclease McrA
MMAEFNRLEAIPARVQPSRKYDDRRSPEAEQYRRLYKTARWKRIRQHQLTEHPLCARCSKRGRITAATVAHHRLPHRGNEALFFDPANLESVCAPCHDGDVQSEEKVGYCREIGADGWPVDPRHPANEATSSSSVDTVL